MKKTLVMLMASLVLLAGLGQAAFAQESVLRIGIAKEPASLNPILVPGLFGEGLADNIFDSLISYKENPSEPAPALATSWNISEDGKTYTFELRNGVKFHNGDPLTAEDVKFTIEQILDPKNASPSKQFFSPVASVETKGDYTVILHLTAPYAPLLKAIGSPNAGIIPKKYVEKVGMEAFDDAPVGTGAFMFVEWLPDERIVLKKNPDYYLGTPNIDKVIYRPISKPEVMAAEIESGGLDLAHRLTPQDIKRLSEDNNLNVQTIPGLGNSYVGFSAQKMPFADPRFRKAVYYAMPFDAAIKGIWRDAGQRAYTWIPEGVFPEDKEYMKSRALSYNPAKAKALFDELRAEGIITDGMEFPIYTPSNPFRTKMATAIATTLRKYGMNAKVESPEWATLITILKNDPGFYIMGWGSVPEPDRWVYKIFHSSSNMNFSKYNNPEVDKALELGRTLVTTEDRGAQYKMVMRKVLGDEYIHIPLVFKNVTVISGKNVKDFKPSPQDYFHLVTNKRNVSIQ